ncbi:MAG TPA: CvpA family protein [Verrucomicrobiae bacterium]|nr:CvpA family protein [Verrucomicrobiae bacterium]
MNWADWFLIAALVISILIGVLRGFTREVLGLASWILAIIAALLLAPTAATYLEPHIDTPSMRIVASYAVVFFGALVLGAVITALVSLLVRKSVLSGVDRAIGAGFGAARGVLVAVLLVWMVGMTPARQDPWWGESALIPPLARLASGFERWMPQAWRERVAPAAATIAKEGV